MITALIAIASYILAGVFALLLLELFTKRISSKFQKSAAEAYAILDVRETAGGSLRATKGLLSIALLFFWPVAIIAAFLPAKKTDTKEETDGQSGSGKNSED